MFFCYDYFFSQKFLFLQKKQNTKFLKQLACKKAFLSAWQIILLSFCLNPLASFSDDRCQKLFSDPQSFNKAMTENLILHPHQESLFELYRLSSFEAPQMYLSKNFNDMMNIWKTYPELAKIPLREHIIYINNISYKTPNQLSQLINSLNQSAGRVKNNLFKIRENLGYWKTLLDFPQLDKKAPKDELKAQKSKFLEHLNSLISKQNFQILDNLSYSHKQKSLLLYQILNKARKLNIQQNKDIKRISQAMVDIIHISGFHNKKYKTILKNKNPEIQLNALYRIINERDILAKELGFSNFLELQNHFNIDYPTGLSKNQDILSILNSLEREIEIEPKNSGIKELRVRPLSLQESPFRSCMGKDCASDSEFEKGLDPNFHYFTLTNSNNKSSGQITVVLGSTKKNNKTTLTAFVDKIQNVPLSAILPMLESIRLSFKEQGYTLGIPKFSRDFNSLSNTEEISDYIDNKINPYLKQDLMGFYPHENKYDFKSKLSRAYDRLNLLEFNLSSEMAKNIKITPGAIQTQNWAPKNLNLQILLKKLLQLRDSKKEKDQIQFISNLTALYEIKALKFDFKFIDNYLNNRIQDLSLSFNFRKFALFYWLTFLGKQEYDLKTSQFVDTLKYFSKKEEEIILGEISNWKKSSNRYKRQFIYILTINFFQSAVTNKSWLNSKLKNIIDINSQNEFDGSTPLMTLIREKNFSAVRQLIKHKPDIHIKNLNGDTALSISAEYANPQITQQLIELGAEINITNIIGNTPLITALYNKHYAEKIVLLLIKNRADMDIKNIHGNTALIIAAKNGPIKNMKQLIEHGADINTKNKKGETALMIVSKIGSMLIFHMLIEYGSHTNIQDREGRTALMLTISEYGSLDKDKAQLLLNKGADVNIQDKDGKTALMSAVKYGREDIVQLFLNKGADVNIQDKDGKTALMSARENKLTKIEKILIEHSTE